MATLIERAGRAAIVTGSSRGIGNSIATGLASAGYNVVISSKRADAREAAADRINETQGRRVAFPSSANCKADALAGHRL